MNTYSKTKIGLIQFLLLFLISAAYGQKVKYKDVYALLSTKQYEQAEPFLKKYLAGTDDNPNAFLFMAIIYEEKAAHNDVLKQTALTISYLDSAILFYDRAYKTINEREVKRNKEYYQNYNRRDLRTGEFGIKLSDIQFDIEKKIQAAKKRAEQLRLSKNHFQLADSSYRLANASYRSLQEDYPSLKQLCLRATTETVENLISLSSNFESSVKEFGQYKSTAAALGKTGYDQELKVSEISDFKSDGSNGADFFADEVKVWNYRKFADETRKIIEEEIVPMRSHLVSYDMEINKLREKLDTESVSVRSDLTKLVDKLLYDQLKKHDAEPLPALVFGLKTTDLEYKSVMLEHEPLRDSADLHFQIRLLNQELSLLKQIDSIAALLPDGKLAQKVLDYQDFVSATYSSGTVLKSFISSERDYGRREYAERSALLNQYMEGLNYVIDGADSIPLLPDAAADYAVLATAPERFTVGLSLKDSTQLKAYFYMIESSRISGMKAHFPVDKVAFKAKEVSAAHAITYSDPSDQIFYVLIYSGIPVKSKVPATLAKIYRADGLAWKADYSLAFVPTELIARTDEVIISNGEQELIVDKNGKVSSQ